MNKKAKYIPALFIAVLCGAMLSTGCGQVPLWSPEPFGMVGMLSSDITVPNYIETRPVQDIQYDSETFEIVGWFEEDKRSFGINVRTPIGSEDVVGAKSSDYASTFAELLMENRLDGMLNKTVDTQRWRLNLFFVRFGTWRTRVGGVGFRVRQ